MKKIMIVLSLILIATLSYSQQYTETTDSFSGVTTRYASYVYNFSGDREVQIVPYKMGDQRGFSLWITGPELEYVREVEIKIDGQIYTAVLRPVNQRMLDNFQFEVRTEVFFGDQFFERFQRTRTVEFRINANNTMDGRFSNNQVMVAKQIFE